MPLRSRMLDDILNIYVRYPRNGQYLEQTKAVLFAVRYI